MTRTRKRTSRPPLLDPLEPRQLLSAAVTQIFTPHIGGGIGDNTIAQISGVTPAFYFADLHAQVTWDNGQVTNADFGGSPSGILSLYATAPEGVGTHTGHVEFWQDSTDSPTGRTNQLAFDFSEIINQNSDGGTTLTGQTNQPVNGYLGTLKNLTLPGNPQGPVTGPFYSTSDSSNPEASETSVGIDWGDGTGGVATLIANPNGGYDVYGSHTYTGAGSYRIQLGAAGSVCINPNYSGPPGFFVLPAFVTLFDRTISTAVISDPQQNPSLSDTHTLNAKLTEAPIQGLPLDPGTMLPPGLTATSSNNIFVDWGDNTPLSSDVTLVTDDHGGFDFVGQHTFVANGTYVVKFTGAANTFPTTPTGPASGIYGANFSVTLTGPAAGIYGINISVTLIVTDSGISIQNTAAASPTLSGAPVTPLTSAAAPSPTAPATDARPVALFFTVKTPQDLPVTTPTIHDIDLSDPIAPVSTAAPAPAPIVAKTGTYELGNDSMPFAPPGADASDLAFIATDADASPQPADNSLLQNAITLVALPEDAPPSTN